jgi:hypothetical protein
MGRGVSLPDIRQTPSTLRPHRSVNVIKLGKSLDKPLKHACLRSKGPRLRSSAMGPILLNLISRAGCTSGHRGRLGIGQRRIAGSRDKGPFRIRPRIFPFSCLGVWR